MQRRFILICLLASLAVLSLWIVALVTIQQRVVSLYNEGKYREAIPLAELQVRINKSIFSRDHPETAEGLNNLALLYNHRGRYAEAEPLCKRALAIYEKARGPDHPLTATSLNNLAMLYHNQGRYAEAEPVYQRALAIHEKARGPDHPSTAPSLNNLALLYDAQGRYAEAEPLYRRALAINEKALGPDHPSTALSLNNLAKLYQTQGRYAEAEPVLRRALAINEKALGPDNPATATSLNNLAELYRTQGRYAEAQPLFRRALVINEKALGPDHPSTAQNLNNFAGLYYNQSRYAEAEPLYRHALAINEKALGPDHPDTALNLNNLALLYADQGRYAEAEPLYRRALAIAKKALVPDHPNAALSLKNLAVLHRAQGRYTEAQPLLRRALAISEKALGPDHHETATSLANLALLHRAQAQWPEAIDNFRRGCRIFAARAGGGADKARGASEQGQLDLAKSLCDAFLADSLARLALIRSAGTARDGLLLEAFGAVQATGTASTAAAFARGAAQLAARQKGAGAEAKAYEELGLQIAALDEQYSTAAGRGGPELASVLRNLAAERARLVASRAASAAALRAKAPAYFDLVEPGATSVDDLRARILREGEALVALVPGAASKDPARRRLSQVFVVTKQGLAWAVLPDTVTAGGRTLTMDEAIEALRRSALGELETPRAAVVSLRPDALKPYDRTLAHAIYQALFESNPEVQALLSGPQVKNWTLVPQGIFLSLPFTALVTRPPEGADGDAAALRRTAWLGWERDLQLSPSVTALALQRQGLQRSAMAASGPAFLGFGDPDFARSGESRASCPPPAAQDRAGVPGAVRSYFRGGEANPTSLRALPRLPGTCREVRTLGAALQAPASNIVLGLAADETGVRRHPVLSSARVIAFATHGLVSGDLGGLAQPALALTPPPEDTLPQVVNDGLLTTVDVASLELAADWVLLSACNTASRDGNAPDGLTGLARAFFFAGARALLVSHWPVDDAAGAQLTTEAIKAMARNPGLTRAAAFREAMRTVATTSPDPRLSHPGFWAPYFLVTAE